MLGAHFEKRVTAIFRLRESPAAAKLMAAVDRSPRGRRQQYRRKAKAWCLAASAATMPA
jgi:hypothetical protein